MWQSNTTKILVGVLSVVIIGCGMLLFRLSQTSSKKQPLGPLEVPFNSQPASSSAVLTDSERIRNLELSVAGLVSVIKSQSPQIAANLQNSNISLESRVKLLETSIADLQARVKALEAGKSPTATATSTKPSTFIPLSWSGSTTSTDWNSITASVSSFNMANYPGATSVTFGASLKTSSSGGRAYARMYNQDDNSPVLSSEVSTDATSYAGVESVTFTLPSASKSYYLQVKSTANYQSTVQNTWLKVNY